MSKLLRIKFGRSLNFYHCSDNCSFSLDFQHTIKTPAYYHSRPEKKYIKMKNTYIIVYIYLYTVQEYNLNHLALPDVHLKTQQFLPA